MNQLIKYPLDLTGRSATNLVLGETHEIGAGKPNRPIATGYGPYYTRSLVVREVGHEQPLQPGVQYVAAQLFVDASLKTGQEICAMVVITDPNVGSQITIDYQVLGGDYSASVEAIEQLIDTLNLDNREVRWASIVGKPEQFDAVSHLHDLGDTYGWEYMVAALEGVRRAILQGDDATYQEIYNYINQKDTELNQQLLAVIEALRQHTEAQDNPHKVTKAQVGLGAVSNFPVASTAEAAARTRNDRYITPAGVSAAIGPTVETLTEHVNNRTNPHGTTKAQVGLGQVVDGPLATTEEAVSKTIHTSYMTPARVFTAINYHAILPLNAHIAKTDNPHQTTKAQVGLGNVDNYITATIEEAAAGLRVDRFMTPAGVLASINRNAGNLLTTHVEDRSNPHAVNKTQVGLGNVQNYPTASAIEATDGTATDRYMTPQRVRQAIDAVAMAALSNHQTDLTNPHQTTKHQVGLGNVDNYATASTSEATSGSATNRFMTPATTKAAISTQAVAPLSQHVSNTSNPHGTTKAQVGLGSVENYPVATAEEAAAGTVVGRYMTPPGVKNAIQIQALNPLNTHVGNRANPHQVTKAQVGLGSVQNFAVASPAEAIAGSATDRYMTPALVKAAIDAIGGSAITAHINNKSNPHGVTKAQIGLGSVQNYASATDAEGLAGTAIDRYMSPRATKAAITGQVGSAFTTHAANFSNPHRVTKAQVGLANVDNFPTANNAEATSATATTRFMTPATTRTTVQTLAVAPLNTHTGNRSNPHQVTKAQVGLGNVPNYDMATTAEAAAGAVNNKLMSPLLTNNAISALAGAMLAGHTGNYNNPHKTDKSDVGLGLVDNYDTASPAEAATGTRNDRFMTPYLVATALAAMSSGRFQISGGTAWGSLREPNTGLTICWGFTNLINTTQAGVAYFHRPFTTEPYFILPYANVKPDTRDTGSWGNRAPILANWLSRIYEMALPAGLSLPDKSDGAVFSAIKVADGYANSAYVGYMAVGLSSGALATGVPAYGRGAVIAPYTPVGPVSIVLSPTAINATLNVQNTTQIVTSPRITPTLSGGTGTYSTSWSIVNNGGRGGDLALDVSGTTVALRFTARNVPQVGNTDTVSAILRCTVTSGTQTATKDITVRLTAKRVFSINEPTNLDFEAGNTGWIINGPLAITQGSAYQGSWKLRLSQTPAGSPAAAFANGGKRTTPGDLVRVSAMVCPKGSTDQVGGQIRLIFLDSVGNIVNSNTVGNAIQIHQGATWRQSVAQAYAPANAAYYTVQVEGWANPTGTYVDFDVVSLTYSPASGTGGGGCVSTEAYVDENRQAGDVMIGDTIDGSAYNPDRIVPRIVRQNRVELQPCQEIVTVSGIHLVASDSTPMQLRDGSLVMLPQMLGREVLVDDDGDLRWEAVAELKPAGIRRVVVFNVEDQSYFAGTVGHRRIATHNAVMAKV